MSSAITFIARNAAKYVCGTATYGFVRSSTYDYKGTADYFNEKTHSYETKEMLWVDKGLRITSSSISATTVWPWMLSTDLTRLECAMRGLDSSEYGVGKPKPRAHAN